MELGNLSLVNVTMEDDVFHVGNGGNGSALRECGGTADRGAFLDLNIQYHTAHGRAYLSGIDIASTIAGASLDDLYLSLCSLEVVLGRGQTVLLLLVLFLAYHTLFEKSLGACGLTCYLIKGDTCRLHRTLSLGELAHVGNDADGGYKVTGIDGLSSLYA